LVIRKVGFWNSPGFYLLFSHFKFPLKNKLKNNSKRLIIINAMPMPFGTLQKEKGK
jgi:hypothetical protein